MSTANTSTHDSGPLAPLTQWHEHDHHGHVVQFYSDDSFLLDALCRFIGTALVAGDAGVVIATKAHRERLAERLKDRGLEISTALRRGRYIALDAESTLSKIMKNGLPDAERFAGVVGKVMSRAQAAAAGERPRIAAFGEMVALLWAAGKCEAAVRLEQLWNHLAVTHSFSLRCAYPIAGFNTKEHSEAFLRVCAEHGGVIPVESYTMLANDEERLRCISQLQQKAEVLEAEIEERKRAERALRESEARLQAATQHLASLVENRTQALRRLSARILSLQDSERRRIARELHDGLGQYLAAAKINLDMLVNSEGMSNCEFAVEANSLVEQAVCEIRTMSYLLHPPLLDEAGLTSAARWYVAGFGQRSGIQVGLNASDDLERLPDAVELALFRMLQEALTNVHRHSGATQAEVAIVHDQAQVVLEVKDNGHGIRPELLARFQENGAGAGVGLTGMGERVRELGGEMRLESDERGTVVRISIPCEGEGPRAATSS